MAILIDLDQTLIDSHLAESHRRARDWESVYRLVPKLSPYPGITVCYHDTKNKKPYPDPILLALERLGVETAGAIAIGDAAKDTQAARSAGVFSIGAGWGALERNQLLQSNPDLLCETVGDLRKTLFEKFEIS